MDYHKTAELLKVIGHPDRLRILHYLLAGKANVSAIEKDLELRQATVSQHLSLLKRIQVVHGKRCQKEVCYEVTDTFVKAMIELCQPENKLKEEENGSIS